MFTGIIEEVGTIRRLKSLNGGIEMTIGCSFSDQTHIDESIAVNGVCQTVTRNDADTFTVQSVQETLRKTTLGDLKEGDPVNLERSLTLDKGIEGHIVQGHVDTTGILKAMEQQGADYLITIEFPDEHRDLVVGRGSIALDGISLTVARVKNNTFTVAIIPYTLEHTNLHSKKAGDAVNLEYDLFGKYVVRYLENRQKPGGLTAEKLKKWGY